MGRAPRGPTVGGPQPLGPVWSLESKPFGGGAMMVGGGPQFGTGVLIALFFRKLAE